MTETNEITIKEIKHLISFIKTTYRFDFNNYAFSSFKRRIERILAVYSIPNIESLTIKLQQNPVFFEEFLREITVNTTEMFRAPAFWRKLRNDVLPILAHYPSLRIWSAACSSGEEVYSLAIVLKEADLLHKTKILATDINDLVLQKGMNGTYPNRNMEVNEKNYQRFEGKGKLSDYYSSKEENVVFDKTLIENVSFKKFDLVQNEQYSKFDLILCRNVMIYFNPELQNKAIELFGNSLFMKGFLAVGEKETIAFCKSSDNFLTFSAEERIYQKIKDNADRI
ncbi:MAG: protein-glutamate O-methyltransferase CheR [Bacteroidetes bacterium]|nr:protein-glutamate O-methyltransferase CheR [Bacteroidota bacterium]